MKKKITLASILAIAVLSLAVVLFLTGAAGNGGSNGAAVRVIPLERQSLETTVNLTGTVYSAQTTEIHSTLHFPVETVNVRVGDRVSEGDVLAVLDMSSMETDVRQLQASLSAAQAAANQNLAAARNSLETFRRNVETGNDPALLNARFGVSNAQLAVQAAEVEVSSASASVFIARQDLREYRRYRNRHDYDRYEDFDPVLSQLRAGVSSSEAALERAQSNLQIARENLVSAQESYNAAGILSANALIAYQDVVTAAQISTNFNDMHIAIQRLQDELEKAEIRASVSGTVTAVIAEEGALGAGLLFVIQDADNLIIKTTIRELDLVSVSIGDRVYIRADATGSAVFTGTLTRIAPTTTQMAYGSNQHGTHAGFEAEIAVTSGESGLKIGMNARLSIVAQQRDNVFVVPAGAVAANEYGERVIYIAVQGEDGGYLAEALPVTTGMETDRDIEVSAEGLSEGALVIRSAEGIQAGMLVTPRT